MSGEETTVDQPTGEIPTVDDIRSIVGADGSGLDRVFNLYGRDAVGPQVELSQLQQIFSQSGYEGVTAALRGETSGNDTPTSENTTPTPDRRGAQRESASLIEAIMAGDRELVDEKLSFFERLAERFGQSGLFNTIKGFIDSIMGSGEPVSESDASRVENMTGNLIDQIFPETSPAPAP